MSEFEWSRYPLTAENNLGRRWLQIQRDLGLAQNILEAYGRGFEEYLGFLRDANVEPTEAGGEVIARYVQRLRARPGAVRGNVTQIDSHSTLSNAALQQRLTIIRLFNDFILDRKSTRLNSSHEWISYAVFCLKKKKTRTDIYIRS